MTEGTFNFALAGKALRVTLKRASGDRWTAAVRTRREDGSWSDPETRSFSLLANDAGGAVVLEYDGGRRQQVHGALLPGGGVHLHLGECDYEIQAAPVRGQAQGGPDESGIASPRDLFSVLPGVVREVRVSPGERVEGGQTLLVIEAMKMERAIEAPAECIVAAIPVQEGDRIQPGDLLARLAPVG